MSLEDLNRKKPFSYRSTKSGSVHISYNGKIVSTLSGREGARFLARVEASDGADAQLVMARATGHFKQGTERASKDNRS